MAKSVLITGCSTGIGASLAIAFQKHGLIVFATARKPSALDSLASLKNVHILALDVTSETSVREAYEQVSIKTGGKLDYLINNAGMGIDLPALDVPVDEGKRLFETNFWGTVRMCQVFAPLVIEAKGAIVNVGSVLGEMAMPYMCKFIFALLGCPSSPLEKLTIQPCTTHPKPQCTCTAPLSVSNSPHSPSAWSPL
jgi:1-acylglycerone phosphate reductase